MNYWAAPDGDRLADVYQSAWEIPTKDMSELYASVQKWTDQGISADFYRKVIGDAATPEQSPLDKDALTWTATKTMTRQQVQAMPIPALQAIFKANVQKLPTYVGSELGGSYVIYKIVKATQPDKLDDAKRKAIRDEYTTIVSQQDVAAYLSSLRQRYKIEINTGLLESRERQ